MHIKTVRVHIKVRDEAALSRHACVQPWHPRKLGLGTRILDAGRGRQEEGCEEEGGGGVEKTARQLLDDQIANFSRRADDMKPQHMT